MISPDFLESQPVLVGLVGAMLSGAVMFTLRALPAMAWERLREMFSVQLVLENREDAFLFVTQWLSQSEAVARARRLMIAEAYDYAEGRWEWRMTLGRGFHLIRYGGAWILLNREVEQPGEFARMTGAPPPQRLWLTSLGRRQTALRALIDEAKAAYFGDGLVKVFVFDGSWHCVDRRRPRSLATVFMPEAQKARIVGDLEAFLASRGTYARRGVPWRRGHLYQGPPGTGKTTMIFAVAGALGRPVFILNLESLQDDNQLMSAINSAAHDAIIVIEDIDSARAAQDRTAPAPVADGPAVAAPGVPAQESRRQVTISGLLNALDGLAAREGRILIATTNHPEKLDPALTRAGRFDLVETIGPLERADGMRMIAAFDAPTDFADRITFPVPAAKLQGMLLRGEGWSTDERAPA